MLERHRLQPKAVVTIGYAARPDGRGVAIAAIEQKSGATQCDYQRVAFAIRPKPALQGREVGYAAVNAVSELLLERGVRDVVLRLEDGRLENDLRERGSLPVALTVPYVSLRCRLNRFARARVETAANPLSRDLMQRALAEATLDIAA